MARRRNLHPEEQSGDHRRVEERNSDGKKCPGVDTCGHHELEDAHSFAHEGDNADSYLPWVWYPEVVGDSPGFFLCSCRGWICSCRLGPDIGDPVQHRRLQGVKMVKQSHWPFRPVRKHQAHFPAELQILGVTRGREGLRFRLQIEVVPRLRKMETVEK